VRVLFLDQFSELGGAQQTLLDTMEAVRRNGWKPHVLVPDRGSLVEALQSRDVPVDEIPCGPYHSGKKSASDAIRFALDLRRQVRAIRELVAGADIGLIYVNGPRLLPAAAIAGRGGAPVVFHLHSHLRGSALRLARWSVRHVGATIFGCSNSVLEPFRTCADASKLHVVPNGVRDAGYRERLFDSLRIGMIGRIAPEKGQMEFVNAAALLKDEFPHAQFVICGEPLFGAPSDYYNAVRLRAHGLPVEFVGWQQDVSRVLNELDLLVAPSIREGMGRMIVEAFSAGVPVIAFPVGGIPEVVIDEETGFLTRLLTAEALAMRIREAIASGPDMLRQVARNARRAWAQSYTVGTYQERITQLLGQLLGPLAPASREVRATEMLQPRR
jgi:glycosyltransferase involved in cell wall biosynthesis